MEGSHRSRLSLIFHRYNQIAAHFDCVKYALVSFAAYIHFHSTKSPFSEEVCVSHASIALKELQKEIDRFGPSNADAIIVSSVALTGATNNWFVPLSDHFFHASLANTQ
jgi:hypothetical protein